MLALRDKRLRELAADPGLTVLRLLCDRRDELSAARAQALNRLHRLFTELIPGGAPVKKSTAQYQALLATVRPRDLAGIGRLDAKLKTMKAELQAAVQAAGSHLMDIHGVGPAGSTANTPAAPHMRHPPPARRRCHRAAPGRTTLTPASAGAHSKSPGPPS